MRFKQVQGVIQAKKKIYWVIGALLVPRSPKTNGSKLLIRLSFLLKFA